MIAKAVFELREVTKDDIREVFKFWENILEYLPGLFACNIGFRVEIYNSYRTLGSSQLPLSYCLDKVVEIPGAPAQILRLGARAINIGGELVGTVDELTLSIEEASQEDIVRLQEAEAIALVKINRG